MATTAVTGLIVSLCSIASAGVSFPIRDGQVEAQLVSSQAAVQPGTTVLVGLRLKMDDGWHTYWQNPGESGQPTAITWNLPPGFVAHDIDWPAPEYFEFGGLASYGYHGEIVLPVRIDVPAQLDESRVTLRAEADWLMCEESCIPGSASLALTLPVTDDPAVAGRPTLHAGLFAWAEKHRPQTAEGITAAFDTDHAVYTLELPHPAKPANAPDAVVANFFPHDATTLNMSARQNIRPTSGGSLELTLTPNPRYDRPASLRGVLVVGDGSGSNARAYLVNAPLRTVADE
ncbi:MAG: protein-disulfide reductase DsbD domain-containing protein [Planctomycetota bacterium]